MTTVAKPDVKTAQSPFELEALLMVARSVEPRRILEIGTWYGGTLWHWLQMAERVVAIDNLMLDPDSWHAWAAETGCELHVLAGSSHDPAHVAEAERLGPYDLVFVDGDHTYDSVVRDWDNYVGMVAEGGMIVFHDINPRPGYGVSEVWDVIRSTPGAKTVEIRERGPYVAPDLTPGFEPGIGVLWPR